MYECKLQQLPNSLQSQPSSPCYDWEGGARVVLNASDQGLAAGQYAVLYQAGVCLGTAKIEQCVDEEDQTQDLYIDRK